jgi:protein phosphatase
MSSLSQFTLTSNLFAAGATDTGLRRRHNEDCFLIDPEIGLLVVADGMGGHAHGEVASAEAVRVLRQFLNQAGKRGPGHNETLEAVDPNLTDVSPSKIDDSFMTAAGRLQDHVAAAILRANDAVYSINQSTGLPADRAMGTTLIGLVCSNRNPQKLVGFHVGDSRMYRLRKGEFELLTRDHTRHQKWLDGGKVGPEPPRNVVLSGVGLRPHLQPTIFLPSLKRGDCFLVCTDGLSDLVDTAEMAAILREARPGRLDEVCQALIDSANQRGGRDNITVIVAINT